MRRNDGGALRIVSVIGVDPGRLYRMMARTTITITPRMTRMTSSSIGPALKGMSVSSFV
jgi:hypothetical protein